MPRTKHFDIDATLDKAMCHFWTYGFETTSMQDLVQTMGINRGSLYNTYGDKRSLFIAALRRYDQHYRQARLAALEREQTPMAAIAGLFQDWIAQLQADSIPHGCLLTNTALELAAHDPEIGEIVAESQKEIEAFFRRLIAQGQIRGEIATGIDVQQTARSLLASLLGLLVLARSRPEPPLLQSIADAAMMSLRC